MKSIFHCLIIPVILFTACTQKSRKSITDTVATPTKTQIAKQTDTTEYLNWDSVKINGIVHTVSLKNILYNTLGKPDSIVIPDMSQVCGSYFNEPFKYVYIKGSQFELHGDSIVLDFLEVKRPGIKLIANCLTLDGSTTLSSLRSVFPLAVNKNYKIRESKEKQIAIMLETSKKEMGDRWILIFEKGYLVEIKHYVDC